MGNAKKGITESKLSYEQAVKFAEQSLKLMKKYSVFPDENSFAIWQLYAENALPELSKEIDDYLAKKKPFPSDFCVRLYDKYVKQTPDSQEVAAISGKLEGQLSNILKALSGAGLQTSNYASKLELAKSKMSEASLSVDGFKSILDDISSLTQAMISENTNLNTQLEKSSNEVSVLNEDLTHLRTQAETDALTGLANRRHMWQRMQSAISASLKKETPLCAMMLDIDHFKNFNDSFGHLVGDQVIKLLANTIDGLIKGKDTAARYGGEEFTIILPETTIKNAVTLANNIRIAISSKELKNKAKGTSLGTITISIGVAIFRKGETGEELLERADRALYAAKNGGRNQVMIAADVVSY